MNTVSPPSTERGFSLVELMIALVLGLVLLGGVIQVFLSSRQTYSANEAMSRMQENGRFALEFMARSARLAGYMEPRLGTDKPFPVVPTSTSGRCNVPNGVQNLLCSSNGAGSSSDGVAFMFQPPLNDGVRRDCLGNIINSNTNLIINHFAIIPANGNTPAALGCRSYNATTSSWTAGPDLQALVEGVDALQVLYGLDSGGDFRSPNQYVSADRVGNWDKVRSIRIAVLANSVETLNSAPAARRFVLLDASPLDAAALGNDNRARQIFTTTIQLKNFE